MIVVTAITDNFVPVIETLCVKEVCPDRKQVPIIFHLYVAVIALFYFSHCVVPFVKYIIAYYSTSNNLISENPIGIRRFCYMHLDCRYQ